MTCLSPGELCRAVEVGGSTYSRPGEEEPVEAGTVFDGREGRELPVEGCERRSLRERGEAPGE